MHSAVEQKTGLIWDIQEQGQYFFSAIFETDWKSDAMN